MTDVVVLRRFDPPLTDAGMQRMTEMAEHCLGLHRVDWHGSVLSTDGRTLVCHFSGPDAESVRIALGQAGSDVGAVWPCTIHDAPGLAGGDIERTNVLVYRRFGEPVGFADLQAVEDRARHCLDAHRVRFVRTYFAADQRQMICLYQAPDAESVRIAQREADMPVERIWAFRHFRP